MPRSRSLSDLIGAGRSTQAAPVIKNALHTANITSRAVEGSGGSGLVGDILGSYTGGIVSGGSGKPGAGDDTGKQSAPVQQAPQPTAAPKTTQPPAPADLAADERARKKDAENEAAIRRYTNA